MFDVIIPIYRIAPELLKRCLDSVFEQSLPDTHYSIWVVDGTPLDAEQYQGCMDIIKNYSLNYFRQSGKGVSQARNEAVTLGNNPYIAFLDGDDYWYPLHLEELNKSIDKTTLSHVMWWNAGDVTITTKSIKGHNFVSEKTVNWHPRHSQWSDNYHGLHFQADAVLFPSSVAVRRSRFEEIGGFTEDLWVGEDQLLWYHLCGNNLLNDDIYLSYQNDFVGMYRQHDEDYFDKGQNPWVDLYGSDAKEKCDDSIISMIRYWDTPSEWKQPKDIKNKEWEDIITKTLYSETMDS
jgi:glycosyltransferase involved in cell wall biosynthesis